MNTLIQRFFGYPLRQRKSQAIAQKQAPNKLPMAQIQQTMRDALCDCAGLRGQRTIYKIDQAKTPTELWELRSDLHQCIAHAHNEGAATARINDLADLFEGWVPASQLIKIQPGFRNSAK